MAASPLMLTRSLLEPLLFPVYHHSLVISLILIILSTIMIPTLYSQFRPLSCTSDSYATLYYLHLTFPKKLIMPLPEASSSQSHPITDNGTSIHPVVQEPWDHFRLFFFWVLIQSIRKFFKIYPTAAPISLKVNAYNGLITSSCLYQLIFYYFYPTLYHPDRLCYSFNPPCMFQPQDLCTEPQPQIPL